MKENRHHGGPELLAPAGSRDSLTAALQAGADAVYLGVGHLQMRAAGAAFSIPELPEVVEQVHAAGKKLYVTLNTVVYEEEREELEKVLQAAAESGVDAVIAADPAVLEGGRKHNLPLHLSTQANICNLSAIRFYAAFADVMVLARELTLEQITALNEAIRRENITGPSGELVRTEIFVHGALCVAVSGKCYMSLAQHNASANRGDCLQACRRKYEVTDKETGFAYEVDNQWVMSPKDLCTLPMLDRLLASGVGVLKIEGRGRSPDYVHTVVGAYREAIDAWVAGTGEAFSVDDAMERLRSVFHRGFWEGGYYLGEKMDPWARSSGSRATQRKVFLGTVENYFARQGVAEVHLAANDYQQGTPLLITGPTTGVVEAQPPAFRREEKEVTEAPRKSTITFPVPAKVRRGDKVYRLEERS
ncbi:MAG: U32 family peptidase [Opitutales bacterium]|nr:U32 family peptidase [Opitutales bacterium]